MLHVALTSCTHELGWLVRMFGKKPRELLAWHGTMVLRHSHHAAKALGLGWRPGPCLRTGLRLRPSRCCRAWLPAPDVRPHHLVPEQGLDAIQLVLHRLHGVFVLLLLLPYPRRLLLDRVEMVADLGMQGVRRSLESLMHLLNEVVHGLLARHDFALHQLDDAGQLLAQLQLLLVQGLHFAIVLLDQRVCELWHDRVHHSTEVGGRRLLLWSCCHG